MSTLREVDARGAIAEGENAAVAETAARKIAAENFMLGIIDEVTVCFFLVTGSRVKICHCRRCFPFYFPLLSA